MEEYCVCCSSFSVQQPGARSKSVLASEPQSVYGHLQCKLCRKHICFSCCTELHTLLTQFTKKRHILLEEKHAILTNPWFIYVHKLLLDPLAFNNTTIPVGHCCSFTSTIGKSPPAISISLPKSTNHHIPNEIFSTGNSSDSDSEYLPHKVIQKKKLHQPLNIKVQITLPP